MEAAGGEKESPHVAQIAACSKLTCLATALAKSLEVSVLPVPAGPSGAPPRFSSSAPISVLLTQCP